MATDAANTFYKLRQDITARADLEYSDKVLFAVIANYQGANDHAWPGIRKLAKDIGGSDKTVERGINRLEAAGLITVERRRRGQSNWYRITESAPTMGAVDMVDKTKSAPTVSESAPTVGSQAPPRSLSNKKRLTKDLVTTSPKTTKTKKSVQKKRLFIEPRLRDVKREIKEKGFIVDPNVFYEWYDCRGWTIKGGDPMKSWRSTLAQWNAKDVRDQKEGVKNGQKTTQNRKSSTEPAPGEAVLRISV